jgi:hypothetical protein
MAEKDLIADAKEAFKECQDAESLNRQEAVDDLRFARLAEQWPESIRQQRELEGRPVLTINRMPTFIRQVVNETRQNRPQMKFRPVGEGADQATASVFDGLGRQIQMASNAEVAYDTASDFAVTMGWGYFRIDMEYASDDSFDLDVVINRVANPFTVYGDPHSSEADSSDWNVAFVTERIKRAAFEARYPDAEATDWDSTSNDESEWVTEDEIRIAEWWTREETRRPIVKLSDGRVLLAEIYEKERAFLFDPAGLTVVGQRETRSHKVVQRIVAGSQVLETNAWSGVYIPIIPVYGEELNIEGERVFKSLIRDAKDAQRMMNFWRSASTELVALAPKVPYIGRKGSFNSDQKRWETANTKSHPYLEYDGDEPPQRQPIDSGPAAGALQEAMNASEDMKAIMGLFDASLGAKSNETSGRAILARQREGDVSTFHFLDNLSRAVKHAGRVIVDLVPKVYNSQRVIRTLSEDGSMVPVPLMQPVMPQTKPGDTQPSAYQPVPPGVQPPPGARIFDLGVGKYDVTVVVGPSFTTRREEAANQMVELTRANPNIAPMIIDIMARNLDWPEADKVAERIKMTLPPHMRGEGPPPEVLQMQQQMQQMQMQMQQMGQQMQQQQAELQAANLNVQGKQDEMAYKREELQFKYEELNVERMKLGQESQQEMMEFRQQQAEQFGQMNNGMAEAHAAIMQRLEQVAAVADQAMAMASKPRQKRGTATKLGDGRWALEAVEDVQQTMQ